MKYNTEKLTTQLNARISPNMFMKLKEMAEEKNCSFSDMVRLMLEKALPKSRLKAKKARKRSH